MYKNILFADEFNFLQPIYFDKMTYFILILLHPKFSNAIFARIIFEFVS
jgi:hypothetical protein